MSIIEKAKEFAIKAHGDQKYGNMPYEYHLQQVVSRLLHWRDLGQFSITDETIAVGWLHDVLEDTEVTTSEIVKEFGFSIAISADHLTKITGTPYGLYIGLVKSDHNAWVVKIADTLCNLEASLMSGEKKRVVKYAKQLALLMEE